jgi:lysozyme
VRVRELLIRHEGLRLKPYRCSAGKLTLGVGRNLDDNGITEAEALHLLENDIARVTKEAEQFPWFDGLSEERKAVIISMIFNLGITRFKGFQKMIVALHMQDFKAAREHMLSSKWSIQVGNRAVELADLMYKLDS